MKKVGILLLIIFLVMRMRVAPQEKGGEEVRGVFISYIELGEQLKGKEESVGKKNIHKMIQNIKELNANTIILQVRAACDAIYDSDTFPYSSYISEKEGKKTFDILEYFLKKAHEENLKVIAWINPYRIRTTEDISSITKNSPAYSYIGSNTIYIKNGIYWNPSKKEVEDLVVEGVKEVLEYEVDGVLFDDYFYPSDEIDIEEYESYLEENEECTLQEYHLQVINQMVEKVHKECQKKKIPFGISPDGNIENNYQKNYADVKKWMKEDKYLDFIMPQLYYGFYNSTKAYTKVSKEWDSLIENKNIKLYIALAFYKVGKEDTYAQSGKNEWLENDNIIMKEIILSRNLRNYKGFALFRYGNLFDTNLYTSTSQMELTNVKKIIK